MLKRKLLALFAFLAVFGVAAGTQAVAGSNHQSVHPTTHHAVSHTRVAPDDWWW